MLGCRSTLVAAFAAALGLAAGSFTTIAHAGLLDDAAGLAIVGGGDARDRVSFRLASVVDGDVCMSGGFVGSSSFVIGDITAVDPQPAALRLRSASVLLGDLVTGGGAVRAVPRRATLPGLTVVRVPGGRRVAKRDGSGDYDTTGIDARVEACRLAQASIVTAAAELREMEGVADAGRISVPSRQSRVVTAPIPGRLNVVDVSRVTVGQNAALVLDGGGDADTVFVLRSAGRVRTRFGGTIGLTGELRAENVIVLSGGACNAGQASHGAGTLLCPDSRISMHPGALWTGALLGGRQVEIGAGASVAAISFTGQ